MTNISNMVNCIFRALLYWVVIKVESNELTFFQFAKSFDPNSQRHQKPMFYGYGIMQIEFVCGSKKFLIMKYI